MPWKRTETNRLMAAACAPHPDCGIGGGPSKENHNDFVGEVAWMNINRYRHDPLFVKALWLILFTGIVCMTAACSSGPKATAKLEDVLAQSQESQKDLKEFNQRLLASVTSAPRPEDYQLSPGDLLEVTVFEAQELKREVRVGDQGSVILPLIGPITIKGLTTNEAARKIEATYRQKYLQDPHVDIFVKEYRGGKITLIGALKKPGTFDYFGKQRLVDVLAMGEGLSEKAGRMVQVRRTGKDPQRPETFLIDLDDAVKGEQVDLNIPIERGDVIYVFEAGTVYVDGAVRKPGNYTIRPGMTINELLGDAGGFATFAAKDDIKLVRRGTEGKRDIIQVSANDLRAGAASGLKLQDKDIVFVETNKALALISGLKLNFFGGIVGVGYEAPRQQ
jgi:polysaccharide export outer membrane protein